MSRPAIDVQEFLASGYQYAWKLLEEEKMFPPFLRVMDRTGKYKAVVAMDGEIATLNRETALHAEDIEAVALFTMATVENEARPPQPVILVHIDVRNGPKKLALTPYTLEGGLECGMPSYEPPTKRLLPITRMMIIYADFNDVDADGTLPLYCQGSVESIDALHTPPREGEWAWLTDGELWTTARLHRNSTGLYQATGKWEFKDEPPGE